MKPGTPLPFSVREIGVNEYPTGEFNTICEVRGADHTGVADHILQFDAAYIVHACNNYPRLVEALRDMTRRDGPSLSQVDAARAVLRELGELK